MMEVNAIYKNSENKNDNKQTTPIDASMVQLIVNKPIDIKLSETEVDKWLSDKKISQSIVKLIKPCDGELLYEFYKSIKQSPDFLYHSVTNTNNNDPVQIRDLVLFSLELRKLFE